MKNKQTNKLRPIKFGILLFISFTMFHCHDVANEISEIKETNKNNIETSSKKEIIHFLKLHERLMYEKKGSNPYLSYDIDKLKLEEITNTDAKLTVIDAKTTDKDYYTRLLFLKINDSLRGVVFNMNPNRLQTSNKFSGEITLKDLDGNLLKGFKVENGIIIKKYLPVVNTYNYKTNNDDQFSAECRITCGHSADDDSCICNGISTDEIVVKSSPSISYISAFDLYGSDANNTENCDTNCDNTWNAVGGGSPNSTSINQVYCNVGFTYDPILKICVEDKIKNELTNPCAKTIFTQLENGIYKDSPLKPELQILADGVNLNFSQTILKLFEESNNTHLTIRNGDTGQANANTVVSTITISDVYLKDATRLSIARTMIHESVHAYLNGIWYSYPDLKDKSLLDKLRAFASANGISNMPTLQHEFMGQYVNAIGYSLYEWDKQYGTGGNLGWTYYQSMAFGGLFQVYPNGVIAEETDAFKALVPDPIERQKIANILLNEQKNNSDAKGTDCE